MARSLDEVKKAYSPPDYAAMMKKALAGIPEGKYETTTELCARVRLDKRQIPALVEKFSAHAVFMGRKSGTNSYLWARTPADAKRLRDELESQNG